ncbi:hypothetical protein TREAZ_1951 [Leadbettera azotonutricia ZAS-9]|uniref:Uncharacterized protein n=1 Tax=Leadbettera azotonutricia (strain ATCC BAA-888 / DSM 13862 / ZAS-9) TaxID=545695 RepID=F5YAQ3_LEAAZ|nr:hypothetical protein TREAZ_1951 [Leadbettera azotonutricia ZAS-9]
MTEIRAGFGEFRSLVLITFIGFLLLWSIPYTLYSFFYDYSVIKKKKI